MIVIALGGLAPACTQGDWLDRDAQENCADELQVPPEVKVEVVEEVARGVGPSACSCGSATTEEVWTIGASGGSCTLTAPANPVCVKSTTPGGFLLTCDYAYGAPACTQLKFSKSGFTPNLVGFVVSDPVCYSSPASPSASSSVTTQIQIPAAGARELRVDWDAWATMAKDTQCPIRIVTKHQGPGDLRER